MELNNYIPEIYLAFSIIILLAYASISPSRRLGIVSLKTDRGPYGQITQKNLAIFSILITSLLFICPEGQTSTLGSSEGLTLSMDLEGLVKPVVLISASAIFLLSPSFRPLPSPAAPLGGAAGGREWSLLVLLAILGLLLLISSKDFIMFYLSIELLSLSFYILASIDRSGSYSTEAGLKYFLLGALSSGLLLLGIVLIYKETGTTDYNSIFALSGSEGVGSFAQLGLDLNSTGLKDFSHATSSTISHSQALPSGADLTIALERLDAIKISAIFIIIGVLFKLAAAPFHMWAPDVYEGAPNYITALFAIVPKIGLFTALVNLLLGPFYYIFSLISSNLLIWVAILSLIVGAFGAISQSKFKRLLAYSAIGHIGYILLGLIGFEPSFQGLQASFIYMIIYIIMSINTFAIFFSLPSIRWSSPSDSTDLKNKGAVVNRAVPIGSEGGARGGQYEASIANYLSQLTGLVRVEPVLALSFALCILSIAGIPPLAGFYSKLLIFTSLLDPQRAYVHILLAIFAIIISTISCFFYLRIVKLLYFVETKTTIPSPTLPSGEQSFLGDSNAQRNSEGFGNLEIINWGEPRPYEINKNIGDISVASYSAPAGSIGLGLSLIIGITLFIQLTFIFYPQPLLFLTFDSITNSLL